jgi:glycosyltransferase involved in cell wall biosynthesis
MKKILVIYPYNTGSNAFSGGVPKVVVSNIIAIKNNGDIPFLILPDGNNGLIKFIQDNFAYCYVIPVKFKSLSLFSDTKGVMRYFGIFENLLGFYEGKRRLKKAIAKIAPDIIHFHEVINFPILGIFPKAKTVLHLHSYRFTGYGKMLPIIMRKINKNTNIVISPTFSILHALGEKLKVQSKVVDTPYLELESNININDNLSIVDELKSFNKSGKIVFSFVGRICSIKRIDHFIDAIAQLKSDNKSKLLFSIVGGTNTQGDIDYKNSLETMIRDNNLENIVKFHGYVNPIESILPFINYGVILSESEAVPMIGIEYMRFNIPILGYNAPGISDFLIDGKNGLLIKNGSLGELTRKLISILEDLVEKTDFDKTISETFKRHTLEEFTKEIGGLYSNL